MSTHGWAETRREPEAGVKGDLKMLKLSICVLCRAGVFSRKTPDLLCVSRGSREGLH